MKSLKSVNVNLKAPSISLSPMTRWILTVLILGVVVVVVMVLYAQEQTKNDDLSDQVDRAGTTLVQNSLSRRDLEDRLVAANLDLAELSANFPSSKQSMDMEEALYRAAADAGVELTSIGLSGPRAEAVGGSTYTTFGMDVAVTGETGNLLRFAGVLGQWLPSAGIQSVSMGADSMALNLKVYTLGG